MQRAAVYLRSSKDRSEVSIQAQRRALQMLATERGLAIVQEYADVVESAKDERRPGFQQLLRDMRRPDRAWGHLLMVDPSRLSRRQYMAQVFSHEAQKLGIVVLYQQAPPSDPIADLVVLSVLQLVAELHSHMSREKGLAGMAENVRQGWRAGGRAPRGYRLRRVETGGTRDGQAVTKSVLEPDPATAPLVAVFLRARAEGKSRPVAAREAGVEWPETTLVSIERNALVYAGATVWGRHAARTDGGYKGGTRERPRDEWTVQEDTHEALISRAEAEAVLAARRPQTHTRRRGDAYLLAGLLITPDGARWHGDGGRYRVAHGSGKRSVRADVVEPLVVGQVMRDLRSKRFLRSLTVAARREYRDRAGDPTRPVREEMATVDAEIERTLQLAGGLADPAPALRRIDGLETRRRALVEALGRAEDDNRVRSILAGVTEESVERLLDSVAERLETVDRGAVKDTLQQLVERIEMDPESLGIRLCYAIGAGGVSVASPRERPVNPRLRAVTLAQYRAGG